MFDRTVGEAYVLMRADGRLLKRDIKDLGRSAGASYADSLQREFDAANRLTIRRFQRQIAKGMSELDFSGFIKEFGSVDATVDGLGERMEELRRRGLVTEKQFETFADRVIQWGEANRDRLADLDVAFSARNVAAIKKIRTEIAEAVRVGDFSKMLKQFGSIEGVVAGVSDSLEDMRRNAQVSNRLYADTTVELQKWAAQALKVRQQQEAMRSELVQYGAVFDTQVKRRWTDLGKAIADASMSGDFSDLRTETETATQTTQRLTETLARHRKELVMTGDEYDRIVRQMAEWSVRQDKLDADNNLTALLDGIVRRRHPVVQALDDIDDKTEIFAYGLGRAFGKGSRNNFLNFVGSFVGGMTRLVTSVPTSLIKTVTSVGTAFNDGFSAAKAAGLSRFASAGKGIASVFAGKGGVAGAIIGAAVAAIGFGKILPAIASAVSMFAANAVSLVGSVGVGLVGALLALGPAAISAAAGVGVLAAAWASWADSDAGKKILDKQKKEFESFYKTLYPVVRQFNDLFADAFLGLGERVRPGLLSLGNQLDDLFDQRDTQGRLEAWGDSIERMFSDISNSVADFTDGLIAFFVPILPYAERLTGYISDLAQRFSDWAQSAEGQNSIASFMDKAWSAAKALWELLGEIGSLIGTVFLAGADETGTGWIQGWADAIRDFNEYLQSPEGKDALSRWFSDAKEFGEDIGAVIADVVRLFAALDSPEGRKTATEVAGAFKTMADTAVDIANLADDVGRIIDTLTNFVPGKALFDLFTGNVPDIEVGSVDNEGFEARWDSMRESVQTWASETGEAISTWASETASSFGTWVSETGETVGTFFEELPGKISEWAGQAWESANTAFQEGGTALIDSFAQTLEDLATGIEEFDLSDFFAGILESVGEFFTGLGETIATGVEGAGASIGAWVEETWARFTEWGAGVVQRVGEGLAGVPGAISRWAGETLAAFNLWVANTSQTVQGWAVRVPQIISEGIARMGAFLSALPGRVGAWLASLPERMSAPFRTAWNTVNGYFDGAPARLAGAIGRVISSIAGRLSGVFETIVGPFRRAWAEVQRILGNISNISIPNPFSGVDLTPWNAAGNIYSGPTVIGVGEAGREAIVPLDRPLSMVNPNVRTLSAFAQGKLAVPTTGGRGSEIVVQPGAVQVTTAATDPEVVGSIVLDEIADVLYAAVN